MFSDLFENSLYRQLLASITAFVISVVVGGLLIRFFHRRQVIEDTTMPDHAGLNAVQSKKKNVPTMGGLMIIAGILGGVVLWSDLKSYYVLLGLAVVVVLGATGFVDDYIKLCHKPSRGLNKKQKLAVQLVLGAIAGMMLISFSGGSDFGDDIFLLSGAHIDIGYWYILWAAFVMAATSNAVNLTDGLDGLAGGLSVIASLAFVGVGLLISNIISDYSPMPNMQGEMMLLLLITAGAALGFLWYNAHPAQIFMGDTGSLMLGGVLAYTALAMKMDLILFVVAAVFYIDELTVALQIASFKLTGKRIFPITPIHHYFQVHLAWPEQKIVFRFWTAGIVAAAASALLVAACNQ